MKRGMISEDDSMDNECLQANLDTLKDVKEAIMDRKGEMSIVKK
jgi:uncharacterized membrane protein YcaP (DUF421 family)